MATNEIKEIQLDGEDYVFIKCLGRGAYGTVWEAVKRQTNQKFAIKVEDVVNSSLYDLTGIPKEMQVRIFLHFNFLNILSILL